MEKEGVVARGGFPVADGDGVVDRFVIEIAFPEDYPDSVPVVREIGGRIPWFEDRHVNPTGDACPIVPEEWLLRPDHDSILAFLAGPVRNFFIGQILVERGDDWPFGQRDHGKKGVVQSYAEIVGARDEPAIRLYLEYASRDRLKGHWECPCGSKQKVRNCHIESVQAVRQRIKPWIAKRMLGRLNGKI
jgi:hypothetical protein